MLELPVDWCLNPTISSITGNWNLNSLFYSLVQTSNATYTRIELVLNFDIPGKSIFTVKFKPIINPNIATTSNFLAHSIYDSTILDQTMDPTTVSLVATPPSLAITNFNWQPSNEYAISRYNISFYVDAIDVPEGGRLVLYFPDGYVAGLLADLPLTAYING